MPDALPKDISTAPAIMPVPPRGFRGGMERVVSKSEMNTTDSLTALLRKIKAIKGGTDSRTTFVLDTLKEHQTIAADFIDYKKKVTPQGS